VTITKAKNDRLIISVSGLIGAGKDTVGQHLVTEYGFKRMSFSSAIKDAVAVIFGFDREMLDGLTEESRIWRETPDPWWTDKLDFGKPMSPRDIIIAFATGAMRNHFHSDVWMLSLERQIMQYDGNVVLTDTRHLNELALVRRLRGQIWGVWRQERPWLRRFYELVEELWDREPCAEAAEAWQADLTQVFNQNTMILCGHHAMGSQKLQDFKIHESEWQHLLWNDYDTVLKNQGSIQTLLCQVDHLMETLS
jgi:hypothetical protein